MRMIFYSFACFIFEQSDECGGDGVCYYGLCVRGSVGTFALRSRSDNPQSDFMIPLLAAIAAVILISCFVMASYCCRRGTYIELILYLSFF